MINRELWAKAESIVSSLAQNGLHDENGNLFIKTYESPLSNPFVYTTYEYKGIQYYFRQEIPREMLEQLTDETRTEYFNWTEKVIIRGITKNIYDLLEASSRS